MISAALSRVKNWVLRLAQNDSGPFESVRGRGTDAPLPRCVESVRDLFILSRGCIYR